MSKVLKPDICVIGAGSGGLSVAAAAAQFGLDVVLVEKGKMGGDCLNTGCVPSKALLAAGAAARAGVAAKKFGVRYDPPKVDFAKVKKHISGVIAAIEPNDSVARFTGLGVKVIEAAGRFASPSQLVAGKHKIEARRFVIATGSTASVPPIPGLAATPFVTNETIFDIAKLPEHLIVVGGGPIGIELGFAFCRLGAQVTIVEAVTPLANDDPELTQIVLEKVQSEGVRILAGTRVEKVAYANQRFSVTISKDGSTDTLEGSHLLVATGRSATVAGLGLDQAKVAHDRGGITVSTRMKTTNARIFAVGDVAGGLQFTHAANYHAGIVLRNILMRWPTRTRDHVIPWVTYTDPELAWVGMNEAQAKARHGKICIQRWPFTENDRAQTERATTGLIKVITTRRGKILGAGIVGKHAGDLLQPWILAITQNMKIGAFTSMVLPYPTLGEASKRAAQAFYAPKLLNSRLPAIARWLSRLGP
ncbi:MAG: dihydrolipoyl dehydrogenase family protein [Alphaproteobacteria bacterium]